MVLKAPELPRIALCSPLAARWAYAFLSYLVVGIMESEGWMVVLTPLFAAALAMLGRWVFHLGKVRRHGLRLPIALLIGAIGFYASWHIYLNFARSDHPALRI